MSTLMIEKVCKYCSHNDYLRYTWQIFKNGTKHIRVQCTRCRCWSHWAPQCEPYMTRVAEVKEWELPLP